MATRDELIFSLTITLILLQFLIPIPDSPYFTIMGAISAASVWQIEAEFRLKRPQTETTNPPTPTITSTFAPCSSCDGVILEAIMVQLQRMDARLDTLNDELCQVNTHIGRIAR